jgi:tripartite-type tricarboxylate transporter receptor subunit TctC
MRQAMTARRMILLAATLGLLLPSAVATPVGAEEPYPTRPIRFVVPFAAGGINDLVARVFADKMGRTLGKTIIVEARGGGGSRIGADLIAKSPPDGYNLLFANTVTHGMLSTTAKNLPFDPVNDFEPIVELTTYQHFVVVHPSLPIRSVQDLIAYARQHPGKLNYGSSGVGGGVQFALELFKSMAKVDIVHVPYKGMGPAMQDLVAGAVQVTIDGGAAPFIESGQVRGLATSGTQRDPRQPNLPTMEEAGLPGYVFITWQGLLAPKGTPKSIIAQLNAAANAALQDADVKVRLRELGMVPAGGTPEQLAAEIKSGIEKHRQIAADAKLTFD